MPSTMEVPAGMTSATLDFIPFMDFTVDVDAIYTPPPDGNRVTINLLPPTTFTTPERRKKLTLSQGFKLIWVRGTERDEIKRGSDYNNSYSPKMKCNCHYTHFLTLPSIPESSPPLNVRAINEGVIKIRLTWEEPTTPNGIITGYRVSQIF
jgi:hypothetical protein